MTREEMMEQIVAFFEQLSEENKDKFIAALRAGIECNQEPLPCSPLSVGLEA